MIFSPTFAVAVSALMAAGSSARPDVRTDYQAALAHAAKHQKPAAVFIARGPDGFAGLLTDGFDPATVAALKGGFVAVYVDAATPAGAELAGRFELDRGLVISDKSGRKQALRHSGPMTRAALNGLLSQYGGATGSVAAQMTAPAPAPSGQPPVPAPVYAPAQLYAPVPLMSAPVPHHAPAVRAGGCPNGRCGYGR